MSQIVLTLTNVHVTREEFAEISRAARAHAYGSSTLVFFFGIIAAFGIGNAVMPVVQHMVHGGPAVNVCSVSLHVLPWVVASVLLYFFFLRPRSPALLAVMPPAPPPGAVDVLLGILLPILIVGGFAANGYLVPPEPPAPEAPASGGSRYGGLLVLVPWVVIFGAAWVAVFRAVRSVGGDAWQRQPELQRPHTIYIALDGITLEDAVSQRRYAWGAFVGFQETVGAFVLMHSALTFSAIPKRCFANPMSIDQVRGLLFASIRPPVPSQGSVVAVPPPLPQ